MRDAHAKLKTVDERTITRSSGQCVKSAKFADDREVGVFLHLTADTPGEEASIVPVAKSGSTEIEVGTAQPPPENEFMDGDAFLYVRGDHVVLCTTALRDGSIRSFLHEFFRKSKIRHDADQFDLMKVANLDKIKVMRSQGVKEIEVRATMFAATAAYNKRLDQAQGMLGAVAKHFKKILGKPNDVTEDSLRIFVTIKTDNRFTKNLSLGEKNIEFVAEKIINEHQDDDDFVIHTQSGQRITPTEIYVRSNVHVQRKGKSVDRDKAWIELKKFYDVLTSSGAIET